MLSLYNSNLLSHRFVVMVDEITLFANNFHGIIIIWFDLQRHEHKVFVRR